MSANDELQAHTCEKMLEFYGNVANNVANEKVQLLDHIVETTEKVVVEKEVYEAVLRNSVKVADLEVENMQLRQFCEEFNALDVAKENAKLKELLKECKETIEKAQKNYGYDDSIVEILEPVTNKIDEVLK